MKNNNIIEITKLAKEKLSLLFKEKSQDADGIRIKITGGGCSGLNYKIEFDNKKDTDLILTFENFLILIDPKSLIYIKGSILDYQDSLQSTGFIFNNPNAKNTCGCGESFNI